MLSDLGDDIREGLVVSVDCDLINVLAIGERISKLRTFSGGHRSFDILHIATAIELEARAFLSFDANQNELAAADGFATPLLAL